MLDGEQRRVGEQIGDAQPAPGMPATAKKIAQGKNEHPHRRHQPHHHLRGVELSAALPLHADWLLSGNYAYTDSERRGGSEPAFDGSSLDGQPLDKTPEYMAHLRLEWNPLGQLSTYIRANYEGRQHYTGFRNGAVSSRERSASTTVDLGATYRVTDDVSLSATVLNLSDRIVAVDERGRFDGLDGNWMVDEGRRYWVSATLSF